MSFEWRLTTLGDFVRLQRGHDLTASEQRPGTVPVMGSAGPNGTHSDSIAKGPGVVIGRSGASAGKVHLCEVDFWPHNTCLYVTDFLGNSPRFAYYLLQTLNLAAFNSGSAQPSLNRNLIYSVPVKLPSVHEQRLIAEMLQDLDNRIALLRETNATLEAIAQALFKSWFVDFDPVRAKMEGRAPEGMDEATAALFPDSFEESASELVPRGWQMVALADAFDINPSRALKKGTIGAYLDMASLATSGHCVQPPVQREFGSGARFRNGDTLLARITPCLENGKSAFVDFLAEHQVGWGSTEFIVLRPKAPLPAYFGYLLCRHPPFREHAIHSMSGTSGRQRVQNDVLGRYWLAEPGDAIVLAFAQIVAPLQAAIASGHSTSQTLATLRDTLLPRLISGQLRLPLADTPPAIAPLARHRAAGPQPGTCVENRHF